MSRLSMLRLLCTLALVPLGCVRSEPPPVPRPAPCDAAPVDLPNGEPILRLPILAGNAVLCQQGNRSVATASHSYENCLYALDLSPAGGPALDVLAAAPGIVGQTITGAAAGDAEPGHGFGNYVKVQHRRDYFTLYAHLATIVVTVGQPVEAGTVLGHMGDTGKAGNVHLHFSLHRGDPRLEGAPPTVPMHALVAADLDGDASFDLRTSLELTCAPARVSAEGHVYGSELQPGTPLLLGAPPAPLAAALSASRATIARALGTLLREDRPLTVDRIIAERPTSGARSTRSRLETLAAAEPENFEAYYWIAVISLQDLADLERAKTALGRIVASAPVRPSWLMPWVGVRLAQIAEKEGRRAEAAELYRRASERHDLGAEFDTMVRDGLGRVTATP